ncbi:Ubiquitin-conjugating enzyme E2 J1 [Boothiomyces sp. JEL0866]|nr:Ubiquitin-conjugating enzyme E2 J1 [Boothiomyces sp. JEL0866]
MSKSAVKRLLQELKELENDPSPEFTARPLESDILEWHFTIRGPPEGGFKGGRYHGRLIFPVEYPFKPPNIVFLTPNGRFEVNKKICLSITGYHPESWRPSWGVRTALIAIISFFLTKGEGAVGALDWNEIEREKVAKESMDWKCNVCGSCNREALPSEEQMPSSKLEVDPELCLDLNKMESLNSIPDQVLKESLQDAGEEVDLEKEKVAEPTPTVDPSLADTDTNCNVNNEILGKLEEQSDPNLTKLWVLDGLLIALFVIIASLLVKKYT